jgi:hypothetical protein
MAQRGARQKKTVQPCDQTVLNNLWAKALGFTFKEYPDINVGAIE